MYKIRIILDTKEDVLRTLSIDENCNLEQFHYAIANAFGFDGTELASFYRTDSEWLQGEEIPLFSIDEIENTSYMATCILKDELKNVSDKLIYVYDFLNLWSFYIELLEITEEKTTEAKIILSVGEIPETPPQKEFKADFDMSAFDDEFNENFNEFENLDDINFDKY